MRSRRLALILALLAPQAIWADLTVHYKIDFQPGPAFPAAIADTFKQQFAGLIPSGASTRVKGDKCTGGVGPLTSIVDAGKGELTLIDPATKRFATIPAASYAARVAAAQQLPVDAQQFLQNLKLDVQTNKTGQAGSIAGILAEENLITATMEFPGLPISIRIEVHDWLPGAGEMERLPGLKELAVCSAASLGSGDPTAMFSNLLGQGPGTSSKFADAVKAFSGNGAPILRMQMAVYAPSLGALMQAQGAGLATDANAPLVQMEMVLADLSTDSLPDSVFQVPEGYKEAPLEDLLKAAVPGARVAQAQPPAVPPAPPYAGRVYRPGGDVSAPVPIFKPEPKYTEEARKAHVEGSVTLSLVVDTDGNTRNIKVIKSLDPGLDQKAIEAVSQWRFKPGMKGNTTPLAIQAQIEVTFRLLDNPPSPQ